MIKAELHFSHSVMERIITVVEEVSGKRGNKGILQRGESLVLEQVRESYSEVSSEHPNEEVPFPKGKYKESCI